MGMEELENGVKINKREIKTLKNQVLNLQKALKDIAVFLAGVRSNKYKNCVECSLSVGGNDSYYCKECVEGDKFLAK